MSTPTNNLNAIISQLLGRDITLSWVRDDETEDGYVARIDVEVSDPETLRQQLDSLGHEASLTSDDTGTYLWLRIIRAVQIPSLSDLRRQLIATVRDELLHYAGAMDSDPAAYAIIQLHLADPSAPLHVLQARSIGITARQFDEARASYDPASRARLGTDYYGPDGWPAPGVPDVIVLPDGTIAQSMERPGSRNEI